MSRKRASPDLEPAQDMPELEYPAPLPLCAFEKVREYVAARWPAAEFRGITASGRPFVRGVGVLPLRVQAGHGTVWLDQEGRVWVWQP